MAKNYKVVQLMTAINEQNVDALSNCLKENPALLVTAIKTARDVGGRIVPADQETDLTEEFYPLQLLILNLRSNPESTKLHAMFDAAIKNDQIKAHISKDWSPIILFLNQYPNKLEKDLPDNLIEIFTKLYQLSPENYKIPEPKPDFIVNHEPGSKIFKLTLIKELIAKEWPENQKLNSELEKIKSARPSAENGAAETWVQRISNFLFPSQTKQSQGKGDDEISM